jgi:hypothetical protein
MHCSPSSTWSPALSIEHMDERTVDLRSPVITA